jgi:hypothetical protein
MDETILSKIVNGFREPNEALRKQIAILLRSDESWLFERIDQTNNNGSTNHREPKQP